MKFLSLAVLALSAIFVPSEAQTRMLRGAQYSGPVQGTPDLHQALLDAVNAERAKQGLSPMCSNRKLKQAAQLHSDDQAKNNFMSHTGSNGSTMKSRIDAQGFKWNSIGENVAAGQKDVPSVMKSWMNSPGHRANILGKYKFFGGGYQYSASSSYKHYWTQDFGTGTTESCDNGSVTPTPTQTGKPSPAPTTAQPTPTPTTVTPQPTTTTPTPTTSKPTPPPTPAPTPAPTTSTPGGGSLQKQMLDAVNAERAKQGLSPFCTNSKLQKAAQLHSDDQAKNNFMSHTGSNGSTMQNRIDAQGFKWNSIAENVAAGQVDVADVMNSWMNSPGHRANILGNYKFFGMGYQYNTGSTYKHYWTQNFGTGSSEACDA